MRTAAAEGSDARNAGLIGKSEGELERRLNSRLLGEREMRADDSNETQEDSEVEERE